MMTTRIGVCVAKLWIGSAALLAGAGLGLHPVDRAQNGLSGVDGVVAGFEAASARAVREVASFATTKTLTIEHKGEITAQTVAALQFTAPDVKAFAVKAIRGSDFQRGHVIDRLMATEIETTPRRPSASVAINSANYQFGEAREDGDAFMIDVRPQRRDPLLFKGRIWVTKAGFHLKRVEGEPAKSPSFWTRRIHFVSEYAPMQGIWLHVRTVARVKVRLFGEYVIRSECGPYDMVLIPARASDQR